METDDNKTDESWRELTITRGGEGSSPPGLEIHLFALPKPLVKVQEEAESGNAESQFFLALRYCHGRGVPRDYSSAAVWFRKAANQNVSEAEYNLGYLYSAGLGVPLNKEEALRWYRRAALHGSALAQNELGLAYDRGEGVDQNYLLAHQWFHRAAVQGLPVAQSNLGSVYANGQGVSQDYIEAVRWTRLAAEAFHFTAQYRMGLAYANGYGVNRDLEEAFVWLTLAATHPFNPAPDKPRKVRDEIAEMLSSEELQQARARAESRQPDWKGISYGRLSETFVRGSQLSGPPLDPK
jgi:TPR repeat protein